MSLFSNFDNVLHTVALNLDFSRDKSKEKEEKLEKVISENLPDGLENKVEIEKGIKNAADNYVDRITGRNKPDASAVVIESDGSKTLLTDNYLCIKKYNAMDAPTFIPETSYIQTSKETDELKRRMRKYRWTHASKK